LIGKVTKGFSHSTMEISTYIDTGEREDKDSGMIDNCETSRYTDIRIDFPTAPFFKLRDWVEMVLFTLPFKWLTTRQEFGMAVLFHLLPRGNKICRMVGGVLFRPCQVVSRQEVCQGSLYQEGG